MILKLCTLTRASRRADKSVSITFVTHLEQSSEELKVLDDLFQQNVIIAIKEESTSFLATELNDINNIDLDIEDTSKTPSKRLRNVLWLLNKQVLKRDPSKDEFKEFYRDRMEKIIQMIKDKLND